MSNVHVGLRPFKKWLVDTIFLLSSWVKSFYVLKKSLLHKVS
ncbi:hypothetical protein URH17368_2644 [Alicyclobacillus hesperidum URH17-3-68]|nr:hypothetical protein URH17368_2644 [Alicyclobacillus hesperidum URH17-3-68]